MDEEVYSKSRRDGVTNCLSTVPLVEMRPIHLSTLLAPRLSCLLSYINSLSRRFAGKEHTIFFVLSASFESSKELEGAVSALRAMGLGETGHKGRSKVVGCLSGSLSEVDIPGLKGRCGLSCAIAIFDSTRCVPFYSGLPGRKEVQVGRWHSFRKTEAGEENGGVNVGMRGGNGDGKRVDWEELWNRRTSSGADLLPEELRSIPPSEIHSLLYMSVPRPDLFTSAVSDHFLSTSTCLGLIAAPTHFVTGRAVTLFCDERIYGDGAVGLALLQGEQGATVPEVRTEFIGVQRLGGRMTITSKEGNMVNSLDNSNPTRLLLRAVDIAGISSLATPSQTFRGDDEFALGVVSPAGDITRTYKITAGDPAHRGGSISLDAVQAPAEGAVVQFLYRASTSRAQLPLSLLSSTTLISSTNPRPSMAFLTVPESNHPTPTSYSAIDPDSVPLHLQNTFLAASSTGFVLSRGRHPIGTKQSNPAISSTKLDAQYDEPWLCSLPGGMATLEWTDNVQRPDAV